MAPERWLPVVGYEDRYEVSDYGRVRSRIRGELSIRKPTLDRHGYHSYSLWKDGRSRNVRVHILVCAAFIGPRPDGMVIRHLDGDPGHNNVDNLCYGTQSENMLDALSHGRNRQAAQTHCKNGHEYTEENTYRFGPDRRYRDCRTCGVQRKQAHYERTKSAPAPPLAACRLAGHDWTDPRNVYVRAKGTRRCAACDREQRRLRVACECGTEVSSGNLARHRRDRHAGVDLRHQRRRRAS